MGKGLVEQLKEEFTIDDRWIGFELHPETPQEGVPITSIFPAEEVDRMFNHLRAVGAQVGITFVNLALLSNSRLALEASEFAKEHGLFDRFHDEIFRAYFNEAKDIGSLEAVLEAGTAVGIDAGTLEKALEQGACAQRLQEMRKQAEKHAVSAVPTFIINGREKIVGVKPVEEFRQILAGI